MTDIFFLWLCAGIIPVRPGAWGSAKHGSWKLLLGIQGTICSNSMQFVGPGLGSLGLGPFLVSLGGVGSTAFSGVSRVSGVSGWF